MRALLAPSYKSSLVSMAHASPYLIRLYKPIHNPSTLTILSQMYLVVHNNIYVVGASYSYFHNLRRFAWLVDWHTSAQLHRYKFRTDSDSVSVLDLSLLTLGAVSGLVSGFRLR